MPLGLSMILLGKQGNKMAKNYDELTFTDDFMFCKVLENNPEICRELLEMIS